jgi:hypothetical protein
MTKLQEQILKALEGTLVEAPYECEQFTEEEVNAVSKVCLEWIEKAFNESRLTEMGSNKYFYELKDWLKENNL